MTNFQVQKGGGNEDIAAMTPPRMVTAMAMAAALALPIAGVLPVATAMIVPVAAQAEEENLEGLTWYQKCIVREMAIYHTELWEARMNCQNFALN